MILKTLVALAAYTHSALAARLTHMTLPRSFMLELRTPLRVQVTQLPTSLLQMQASQPTSPLPVLPVMPTAKTSKI
jgi:hypothetical protein